MTITTGPSSVRAAGQTRPAEVPVDLSATRTATYSTRRFGSSGLTSAGGVLVGVLVMAVGVTVDAARGSGPGSGVAAAFVASCVVIALRLRLRFLATAVIAAPLLFAGGVVSTIYVSGQFRGSRQLALEAATNLALSAPVLFGGTALAALIALARVVEHLVRRKR